METKLLLEEIQIFCNQIEGMPAQLRENTKNARITLFKRVNFVVCGLQLFFFFFLRNKLFTYATPEATLWKPIAQYKDQPGEVAVGVILSL